MKVNACTMLGASGNYADYQHLKQVLEQMVIDEELVGDTTTAPKLFTCG